MLELIYADCYAFGDVVLPVPQALLDGVCVGDKVKVDAEVGEFKNQFGDYQWAEKFPAPVVVEDQEEDRREQLTCEEAKEPTGDAAKVWGNGVVGAIAGAVVAGVIGVFF